MPLTADAWKAKHAVGWRVWTDRGWRARLQGHYGRTAVDLIEAGLIEDDGP